MLARLRVEDTSWVGMGGRREFSTSMAIAC